MSKRKKAHYQMSFYESDMVWLANEYRKRCVSDPSLTLEEFAIQYGVMADGLRTYIPELNKGISRSIILWHGTTQSRAKSILREGFKAKSRSEKERKRKIFFTRNRRIARGYAEARARRESDQPAVIMCSINLDHYNKYEMQGSGVFAFRHERMDSAVVKNVTGLPKQHKRK